MDKLSSIIGCLLGTAVGDAMGLPYEGLPQSRIKKLGAKIDSYQFFFGKGMISDDTEHICMVAQSLIVSGGEKKLFITTLAWRLKWWLLTLPPAIGLATLKGIIKLWLGFSPAHSGVYSAGNGAAMRSTIIGVIYGHDLYKLCDLVRASTRLTHSDPKAEYGALTVAIAAYLSSNYKLISPVEYYQIINQTLPPESGELLQLIKKACQSADKQETANEFANSLGLNKGISGYIYHTVPIVIQIWLRHPEDYATAIREIILLGGDTDTNAAILGGIIGAKVGKQGIPQKWLNNVWEFPRNIKWIETLAIRLNQVTIEQIKQPALPLPIYGLLPRNLFFLFIVIIHSFRRLLPPY